MVQDARAAGVGRGVGPGVGAGVGTRSQHMLTSSGSLHVPPWQVRSAMSALATRSIGHMKVVQLAGVFCHGTQQLAKSTSGSHVGPAHIARGSGRGVIPSGQMKVLLLEKMTEDTSKLSLDMSSETYHSHHPNPMHFIFFAFANALSPSSWLLTAASYS